MTTPNLVRLTAAQRLVSEDLAASAPHIKAPSYRTIARWVHEGRIARYSNGTGGIFVDLDELVEFVNPSRVAS